MRWAKLILYLYIAQAAVGTAIGLALPFLYAFAGWRPRHFYVDAYCVDMAALVAVFARFHRQLTHRPLWI